MKRLYNSIIILSSVTAISTWTFCKIKDRNFIHIYYTPHYSAWMFITYCFLTYKIINK